VVRELFRFGYVLRLIGSKLSSHVLCAVAAVGGGALNHRFDGVLDARKINIQKVLSFGNRNGAYSD
jgi:hypothetical protein